MSLNLALGFLHPQGSVHLQPEGLPACPRNAVRAIATAQRQLKRPNACKRRCIATFHIKYKMLHSSIIRLVSKSETYVQTCRSSYSGG